MAGGYHVHIFPVPYQYSPESDLCGPSVTAGHFNPLMRTRGDTQNDFEVCLAVSCRTLSSLSLLFLLLIFVIAAIDAELINLLANSYIIHL